MRAGRKVGRELDCASTQGKGRRTSQDWGGPGTAAAARCHPGMEAGAAVMWPGKAGALVL